MQCTAGDDSQYKCIIYLKAAKKIDLKISHKQKRNHNYVKRRMLRKHTVVIVVQYTHTSVFAHVQVIQPCVSVICQ